MNFVVGALLYHASEATVFWLFQILLEEYSLRENYVDGLPGVLKHVQMLDRLIKGFHPHIYQHFVYIYIIYIYIIGKLWCYCSAIYY